MKKYLRRGRKTIAAGVVAGLVPNISGTAAEGSIKSGYATGLSNIGSTFPAQGKIIGATMVLKQVNKLKKKRR